MQITCFGRRDGAGGQALSVISALAFAENHGCRYLHTPFQSISHVEGDSRAWTTRWERFFGLGTGEPPVPLDAEIVSLRQFVRWCRRDPGYVPRPHTVVHSTGFGYAEVGQHDISRLQPKLFAKYHSEDKSAIPLHRRTGEAMVAVHVRRGDVGVGFFRYMPDEPILNTIAHVRAAFHALGRPASFNVYSEGSAEDFKAYSELGCVLHLSTDTFETFHNLVCADVLVAAPSAFSRTAALLSRGIILSPEEEWGVHARWVVRAPDGSFSQDRLVELLEAHPNQVRV